MYYDKEANNDNTLQGRLTELNRSLSQMMRNTSEILWNNYIPTNLLFKKH